MPDAKKNTLPGPKRKNLGGRPRKQLDEKQIIALARMNGSYAEIAAVMGCSSRLLEKRYFEVIKEGHEHLKMSLKRAQWVSAIQNGNVTMQIWLGKQILGQRDQVEEVRHDPDRVVSAAQYISAVKLALGFTGELKPLITVKEESGPRLRALPD